MDDGFEENHI